jgi:hypothetical protein
MPGTLPTEAIIFRPRIEPHCIFWGGLLSTCACACVGMGVLLGCVPYGAASQGTNTLNPKSAYNASSTWSHSHVIPCDTSSRAKP